MKSLKAVFRHTDFKEDSPVTGLPEDMIALFRRIDWPSAFNEHEERATFPELIVSSLANGDALYIQYLGSGDLFQCTTYITIPKPIFGLDIWLFRDHWESEEVEFRAAAVVDALAAFGRKDAAHLRQLWTAAKAHV